MSFHQIVKSFDSVLSFIEEWLLFFLLSTMLAVVFFGVLNRSIIQASIPWSEELARYLMIWGVFVGASLGVKRSVHISVDALVLLMPDKIKPLFSLLAYVVGFVFCAWFFYVGYGFMGQMINMKPLSPALGVPMYYAYAAVPVGFGLMALRYFIILIYFLFEGDSQGAENISVEKSMYSDGELK